MPLRKSFTEVGRSCSWSGRHEAELLRPKRTVAGRDARIGSSAFDAVHERFETSVSKSPFISSTPLWSLEILRITATSGAYLTSVPSLSSASTTRRSEPPLKALPISPCFSSLSKGAPLMREGDFPHAVRNSNIIAVTVDLPLVPATAIVLFDAMIAASRSERCTRGRPRARRGSDVGIRFFYCR